MATKKTQMGSPTAIRFGGDMRRWLVAYSEEHDLTVSQVVRKAVAQYRAGRAAVGADVVRKVGGA